MTQVWFLETADGVRRRLGPGGVTLGRSPRCDVVLSSEQASRVHALAHLREQGPQLVQLGRGATKVSGTDVERERELADGDVIEVPGMRLTLVCEDASSASEGSAWVLEREDGGVFGISRGPFRIGGSRDDDLKVEGWPDHAIELRPLAHTLQVTAHAELEVGGARLPAGSSRAIGRGSTIAHGRERFSIVMGGVLGEGSTLTGPSRATQGLSVVLEFLPRGGRLFVRRDGQEDSALYLPDRRCDLVAVLLAPPEPARAGDFVEDETVITRVWGRSGAKGRTDLNVLVHRLRKDLASAGLDGTVIERAEGGGATRFTLEPGTVVELL